MKPARHKALLIKVTPAERKRAKKVARNLKKSVSEIVRNTFRFLDDQSKRKAAFANRSEGSP